MAKDPAFLFYSQDFYGGTRTMLPEERACYMDLLVFQHQKGIISKDMRKLRMFCSGIDEATILAVLNEKFIETPYGWENKKLTKVINERKEHSAKQSMNGTVGQFWKKAAQILSEADLIKLKLMFKGVSNQTLFEKIQEIDLKNEATLQATLIAMLQAKLKHLEDEIEIEIEDEIIDENKGGVGEEKNHLVSGIYFPFSDKAKSLFNLFINNLILGKNFAAQTPNGQEYHVRKLIELSQRDEQKAIEILEASWAGGWKNLGIPFKNKQSENHGHKSDQDVHKPGYYDDSFASVLAGQK